MSDPRAGSSGQAMVVASGREMTSPASASSIYRLEVNITDIIGRCGDRESAVRTRLAQKRPALNRQSGIVLGGSKTDAGEMSG